MDNKEYHNIITTSWIKESVNSFSAVVIGKGDASMGRAQ